MRRREFFSVLGCALCLPFGVRAQQAGYKRRVGVLIALATNDPELQARLAALHQGLQELGWSVGHNVQIEYRLGADSSERIRQHVAEMIALAPEVIVANGTSMVGPLLQATRTLPIVFVNVSDPVGSGYVASLARPGGNSTGFTSLEWGVSGKWLELLKQVAPNVTRAAVIRDPSVPSGSGQFGAIQAVGPFLKIEIKPIDGRDVAQIEREIRELSKFPNSGLIVAAGGEASRNRDLIIKLSARYKLPAVYAADHFVTSGGLMSYGPSRTDEFRRAAGYVDRILKGEKPADLPVQAPVKYELTLNLKTAGALGLTIPPSLLARADNVIQ